MARIAEAVKADYARAAEKRGESGRGDNMNIKTWTFEDEELPTVDSIELDLEWSYSYDAGRYSGPPEDCYPDAEDSEINVPAGYEQIIMAAYIRAAQKAIKAVDAKIEEMNSDNLAREWAEEEAENYENDFADSEYDRMREAA